MSEAGKIWPDVPTYHEQQLLQQTESKLKAPLVSLSPGRQRQRSSSAATDPVGSKIITTPPLAFSFEQRSRRSSSATVVGAGGAAPQRFLPPPPPTPLVENRVEPRSFSVSHSFAAPPAPSRLSNQIQRIAEETRREIESEKRELDRMTQHFQNLRESVLMQRSGSGNEARSYDAMDEDEEQADEELMRQQQMRAPVMAPRRQKAIISPTPFAIRAAPADGGSAPPPDVAGPPVVGKDSPKKRSGWAALRQNVVRAPAPSSGTAAPAAGSRWHIFRPQHLKQQLLDAQKPAGGAKEDPIETMSSLTDTTSTHEDRHEEKELGDAEADVAMKNKQQEQQQQQQTVGGDVSNAPAVAETQQQQQQQLTPPAASEPCAQKNTERPAAHSSVPAAVSVVDASQVATVEKSSLAAGLVRHALAHSKKREEQQQQQQQHHDPQQRPTRMERGVLQKLGAAVPATGSAGGGRSRSRSSSFDTRQPSPPSFEQVMLRFVQNTQQRQQDGADDYDAGDDDEYDEQQYFEEELGRDGRAAAESNRSLSVPQPQRRSSPSLSASPQLVSLHRRPEVLERTVSQQQHFDAEWDDMRHELHAAATHCWETTLCHVSARFLTEKKIMARILREIHRRLIRASLRKPDPKS